MHSDGFILDIIPDLIELGLDALNAQIFCMDVEELGRRFPRKADVLGGNGSAASAGPRTPAEVAAAVHRVHRALYQDGGVIASWSLAREPIRPMSMRPSRPGTRSGRASREVRRDHTHGAEKTVNRLRRNGATAQHRRTRLKKGPVSRKTDLEHLHRSFL